MITFSHVNITLALFLINQKKAKPQIYKTNITLGSQNNTSNQREKLRTINIYCI